MAALTCACTAPNCTHPPSLTTLTELSDAKGSALHMTLKLVAMSAICVQAVKAWGGSLAASCRAQELAEEVVAGGGEAICRGARHVSVLCGGWVGGGGGVCVSPP